MIVKTFKIKIATETEKEMQKEQEWLEMNYGAEEVETGWGELFLLDGMSQFIKKEMDELLKSPWAQDKTLTPHDMAVKEAFATVKDLILSKFEIKEGWENLIYGVEVNK